MTGSGFAMPAPLRRHGLVRPVKSSGLRGGAYPLRVLALALALVGCGGAAPGGTVVLPSAVANQPPVDVATPEPTPTPTPEPTPTPVVAADPVIIKGTNDGNTKRFELGPGDYQVVISGKSTSQFGGNVIISIYNADGERQTLANEIVEGKGSFEYTTYQYDYAGGLYYLDVVAPSGTWSVAFTPA